MVTKTEATKKSSIMGLMNRLFLKHGKELTVEIAIKEVKKYFPKSAYVNKPKIHFAWYKGYILGKKSVGKKARKSIKKMVKKVA